MGRNPRRLRKTRKLEKWTSKTGKISSEKMKIPTGSGMERTEKTVGAVCATNQKWLGEGDYWVFFHYIIRKRKKIEKDKV